MIVRTLPRDTTGGGGGKNKIKIHLKHSYVTAIGDLGLDRSGRLEVLPEIPWRPIHGQKRKRAANPRQVIVPLDSQRSMDVATTHVAAI